ncbi:20S proteasome beta subunit, type 4 [Haematococcus lacustris]
MIPRPSSHSKALGPGVTGPELLYATSAVLERPTQPTPVQPTCGAQAFVVDGPAMEAASAHDPRQHTKQPYVTGTSVIGIKYKDGVMLVADTLGAYGSTKRYKSMDRIVGVNKHAAIAAGGEISDFQYIQRLLDELVTGDFTRDDGIELQPAELHAYLCRVMYNRRNKMDPLWNSLVIGGVGADGKAFLGLVGMQGTHYTDSHVTTGFANALARPILRERQRDDMSEADAEALLHDVLRVLYYRDKQTINKYTLAKVTAAGVSISEPFTLETQWGYKLFAAPTKWAVGAW